MKTFAQLDPSPYLARLQWKGRNAVGLLLTAALTACSTSPHAPSLPPPPKLTSNHVAQLSLQLIASMEQQQKWYAALSYLDAYRQQHEASAEYSLLRARALAATGRNASARQEYAALAGTGLAAFGEQGLGLLDAKAGHSTSALRHFRKAAQLAPTNAAILNDLGYAYLQNREWDAAREALYRAAELAPDNDRVWSNIAVYLLVRGEGLRAQELMDAHRLPWNAQRRIHQLAAELSGRPTKDAAGPTHARSAEGTVELPQPPLSQVFSGKESIP